MNTPDFQSRYINALRTQAKAAEAPANAALPCPYPQCSGRIFITVDQLFGHAKDQHRDEILGLEPREARAHLQALSLKQLR